MTRLIRITTIPLSLDKLLTNQLKYMVDNGMEVFMVSSFADNICELERRESSKFFIVNMTRTITPIKDFFSLVRLVRILIKLKPSIVHTHTPKAGLIGMFSAWVTRVPIRLHTVAGLPLMEKQGPKRLLLEMVEKITYACASKIYPNSTSLKKFILKSNFCSPYKLKVIGNGSSNGINTKYFNENNTILKEADKIKKEFNITADNFVFIFIGRLVKDKGIEELVQAFSQLHKVFSQSRLLLVGSFEPELDPLSNNCLQVILNSKTIIHAGFQNDVRPYLSASHALAFPSYREGFPNVPMQAGCFNLPCIVTDINGCNEIIEHEVNGLIIPPKDTVSLQAAMHRLIVDSNIYLKLKLNARKMIVERYEQTYFWKLLLTEYQSLLKDHGVLPKIL